MKEKGLLVMFPGTGYTCREPLFQLCAARYAKKGYHVLAIDHSHIPFKEIETIEEAMPLVQQAVLDQSAEVDFGLYGDLVFVSKSLGTIPAGWFARERGLSPRHLYLTPVPLALSYVSEQTRVMAMVIGDQDPLMDFREIQRLGGKRHFPCLVIEGVGQNLKAEDETRTAAINKEILDLCTGEEQWPDEEKR